MSKNFNDFNFGPENNFDWDKLTEYCIGVVGNYIDTYVKESAIEQCAEFAAAMVEIKMSKNTGYSKFAETVFVDYLKKFNSYWEADPIDIAKPDGIPEKNVLGCILSDMIFAAEVAGQDELLNLPEEILGLVSAVPVRN